MRRNQIRNQVSKEEIDMITRHNLAEQLREYQIRSKNDWASTSFFSSNSNFTSMYVLLFFSFFLLYVLGFLI